MTNFYIKETFEDSDGITTFYVHYQDGYAIRQIEINNDKIIMLTTDKPIWYDSDNNFSPLHILSDQRLNESDLKDQHIISKNEFESEWEKIITNY